jgi:sarcosine oxidase
MASASYDVIVAGTGAIGSAACWRLANRGVRVLGLDAHPHGHDRGSSHGESRLIRQAYFEHPAYVPLLRRAYDLWQELEAETSTQLLNLNGLIIFGPNDGTIIQGVRESARQHKLTIEEAPAKEFQKRWSGFSPPATYVGVYEANAGYLHVEAAVRAQAAAAEQAGAVMQTGAAITSIKRQDGGFVVEAGGQTYAAPKLVVTAGAWAPRLLPELKTHLKVHRVPLVWFANKADFTFKAGVPCYGFDTPGGFYYGLPAISQRGAKLGLHKPGSTIDDPARLDRELHAADTIPLQGFIRAHLPGLETKIMGHTICMYTMSPDEHFIVDTRDHLTYAAGFSGHGFKFAPVIGEALADLALTGKSKLPIAFLRADRLQA